MFLSPVTEDELMRILTSLKGKRSAGVDEVPEFIIKRCAEYTVTFFCFLRRNRGNPARRLPGQLRTGGELQLR